MLKKVTRVIILIIIGILLMSCKKNDTNKAEIIASNYPIYDITKTIVGDKLEISNITGNQDIHEWEAKPEDIININDAKIFFYLGEELETWTKSVINEDDMKGDLVNISTGVELLSEGEQLDPHIWLSLRNAKVLADNIYTELIKIDEGNKDYYKENLDRFIADLDALDQEYVEKLENVEKKSILVSHEAYGYLCKDYDLIQIGIEGLNAEGEPSIKQIDELINKSKELGIKTVFYEESINAKAAEIISEEIGGKLVYLNPLEALNKEEVENKDNYFSIMKKNLEKIYGALNE